MEALVLSLELLGGLIALTLGADWLVKGSSRFAQSMGVKPLIIGLTLVAFGTSTPELAVSMDAAIKGNAGISIGNIVGSNICNIALILGVCALIRPLPISHELFARDIPIMLVAAALLAGLPFIGGPEPYADSVAFPLSRWKGGVLLAGFAFALWLLLRSAASPEAANALTPRAGARRLALLWALASLGLLVGGGYFFVEGASSLARTLGVSQLVIGLTVVAVGTSLPEFATSLTASLRGQADIAVGNIVGSNTFNVLFILGLCSLVSPLMIEPRVLQLDIPVMLLVSMLLPMLSWKSRQLGRGAGAVLLAIYAAYTLNLFFNWI